MILNGELEFDFIHNWLYNSNMIPKTLINNTATAYVLAKYLQEFCQQVGVDKYLTSPVRLQHGNGTGGFGFKGVGNPHKRLSASGNNDCTKERFRGITDSLDLTFRTIDKIKFRTASCVNLVERSKTVHRIEHTEELIDLYLEFELEYIIGNKPFTPNELAKFVLQRTLVCLIEQKEQKAKGTFTADIPFSKYSNKVFYEGTDVSEYTKAQLLELTAKEFASVFAEVDKYDWSKEVTAKHKKLIATGGHHSLPPLDIAVKYSNDAFNLLKYYYHYQLAQLTDPNENLTYYNEALAQKYNEWKAQNEKLSMA